MKSLIASILFFPTLAIAALLDRGGGLVYDDVLGVTWFQSTGGTGWGGNTKGQFILSCSECFDGSAPDRGLKYVWNGIETSGWRLPKRISDPAIGYTSELDYMFKVNLGLNGRSVPMGNRVDIKTSSGVTVYGVTEDVYWMAERWNTPDGFGFLWSWEIDRQPQLSPLYQDNYGSLWYVRDGDISSASPVPEPKSSLLFAMALAIMVFISKGRITAPPTPSRRQTTLRWANHAPRNGHRNSDSDEQLE